MQRKLLRGHSLLACLALIGAASFVLASPSTGLAACQSPLFCYSESYNAFSGTFTGLSGTWQDANLSRGDGNHINTTLWYVTDLNRGYWVEVGLLDQSTCGNGIYCNYWADSGTGGFKLRWTQDAFTDGATHTYSLQQNPNPGYSRYVDAFYDGNYEGTSADQQTGQAAGVNSLEVGGEVGVGSAGGLDPTMHTGGFDLNNLGYRTTSGAWYLWPSFNYYIDQGCGIWPTGYCLNGTAYHNWEWSWNKP